MIAGILFMFYILIHSVFKGERVTQRNLWGGETLEWTVPTPPPLENFDEALDIIEDPYAYKQNEFEAEEVK
jgi:cytochrome c oxidase subunit 1